VEAPSRRTILTGAAAGLASVAGCAKYGEPQSTPAPAPADTVLGPTADIPVGGGKIFAPQQVVVTQPVKGTFKAFSSICTHQSCPVAAVTDTINCDCHGSKFSITDGSVVNPPATQPLAARTVTVKGDILTVS
jgi:nitrite reductase/ring-hydroxylating ferredoxin subunit